MYLHALSRGSDGYAPGCLPNHRIRRNIDLPRSPAMEQNAPAPSGAAFTHSPAQAEAEEAESESAAAGTGQPHPNRT